MSSQYGREGGGLTPGFVRRAAPRFVVAVDCSETQALCANVSQADVQFFHPNSDGSQSGRPPAYPSACPPALPPGAPRPAHAIHDAQCRAAPFPPPLVLSGHAASLAPY